MMGREGAGADDYAGAIAAVAADHVEQVMQARAEQLLGALQAGGDRLQVFEDDDPGLAQEAVGRPVDAGVGGHGAYPASTRDPVALEPYLATGKWDVPGPGRAWTDDYTNIVGAILARMKENSE